jgi:hypothetical protein
MNLKSTWEWSCRSVILNLCITLSEWLVSHPSILASEKAAPSNRCMAWGEQRRHFEHKGQYVSIFLTLSSVSQPEAKFLHRLNYESNYVFGKSRELIEHWMNIGLPAAHAVDMTHACIYVTVKLLRKIFYVVELKRD